MSQRSAALYVELRPSRILYALLLAIHGGALAILLLAPLSWPPRILLALLLLLSLRHSVARWALLERRRSVVALARDRSGEWRVTLAGGEELEVRLLPDSFVSTWLVVLNFSLAESSGSLSAVILPDMLDGNTLRRLRVLLSMEGTGESE